MKYIFHFCRPYLRKVRGRLSLLIGLYIVVSLTGLVSPYVMGQFIDRLLEAESLAFIRNYIILLAALAFFEFFMSYICERLYIRVQIGSGYALNAEAIHHLQKVRFGFSQGQNAAFLNQQINNDANSAVIFCITILQNIVANVLSLIVPFVLILLFEPWLGLCMVVLNILYFILYNIFKKPVYQADYAFKEEQAAFFSKLNGQISDIQFIQAQGLADSFIRRLDRSVKGLLGKALHSQRASFGFTGSDVVIRTAASIAVRKRRVFFIILSFRGYRVRDVRKRTSCAPSCTPWTWCVLRAGRGSWSFRSRTGCTRRTPRRASRPRRRSRSSSARGP